MKRNVLLFVVLLALPAFAAAQSQTRERRSTDSEPISTGASAVRSRVVGSTRAANHVEKSTATASKDKSGARSKDPKPGTQVSQTSSAPAWGNTAVIIPSVRGEQITARESSPPDNATIDKTIDKKTSADQSSKPAQKLVQQTARVIEVPATATVANTSAPSPLATRGGAPTVLYHVGIGDVLDIRLSNLPTRESTLFTVLKNGSLEYPLLSSPLAVAGLTTDEIARLLSNEIKVIKTARVSVSVRDYASHIVVITGLVDSPGRKTMRREAMPLFAVLAEALPRPEASLLTLVRNGNSQSISLSNEQAMSTLVLPGDAITISGGAAARFVYVGGDVASRGEKEFREGMTLTQAILSAGGVARSNKTSVKVARRNSSGFLMSNEYNLQSIQDGKSQDPLLEAGDRIEVTRGM